MKKKGIFLINGLKNSASKIVASKATKMELPKDGVPNPRKNSLKKNPAKILPKANKKRGINMYRLGSWACSAYFLKLFGLFKKTKKAKRQE